MNETILDEAPVSAQQEAMLEAVAHAQKPQVFNVPTRIRLAGRLNVDALGTAINRLVARHVALRCRFTTAGGTWRQQELAPAPVPLDIDDVRDLPAPQRESRVDDICRTMAETPFDLGRATVPRCRLLRLDAERWVLMFVLHHISTDGWATRTVLRELAVLYRSAVTETPAALPVPVTQCTDYARWQRDHTDAAIEERNLAFIRRRLHRAPLRLDLPTDRPRASPATGAGDTVYLPIPAARVCRCSGRPRCWRWP